MGQLTEQKKLQVRDLVEKFITKTLGNEDPKQMCFAVCYPLFLHLENNGIENTIRNGIYSETPHYWLNLEDENNTIIDPTLRQFHEDAPYVFIGEINTNYEERDFNFEDTYNYWLTYCLRKELPPNFDINVLLRITKKAGLILQDEIQKMRSKGNFVESEKQKKYFKFLKIL